VKHSVLQKSIKWTPHDGQKIVLKSKEREKIICAGRRWGKSVIAAYIVVKTFLELVPTGNAKIWIVAPTYDLTNKVFNYVSRFLLLYDKRFSKHISGGTGRPYTLKLNQDVWIECKSTDSVIGLLGEELDLIVADEAPLIGDNTYRQYILPTTISRRKTKVIYIGTPRGKGWYYNKYINSVDGKSRFHFKSIDGVDVTQAELDRIKKEYPDEKLFLQEYEATFMEDASQVFRDVDDITKEGVYKSPTEGYHYIMGVDIAESVDFTVFSIIEVETNTLVYWKRFNKVDYPTQIKQIIATACEYNMARIVLDSTGLGKPIYEILLEQGVFVEDFTFSGKSKEELIGKLRLYIAQKWITISKEPILLEELKSFEYKLRNDKTGEPLKNIKYGAPSGYHDDCVDSLALAVWGLNPGKPTEVNYVMQALKQRKPKPILSDI